MQEGHCKKCGKNKWLYNEGLCAECRRKRWLLELTQMALDLKELDRLHLDSVLIVGDLQHKGAYW